MRIVLSLMDHDALCACQITELLGVRGATASRHLSQLTRCGLLASRKDGRWVWFSLSDQRANGAMLDWLKKQASTMREYRDDKKRLRNILAMDPETLCRQQRGDIYCPPGKPRP